MSSTSMVKMRWDGTHSMHSANVYELHKIRTLKLNWLENPFDGKANVLAELEFYFSGDLCQKYLSLIS